MLNRFNTWDTDPEEMKEKPFYRVMGFVVDKESQITNKVWQYYNARSFLFERLYHNLDAVKIM